MPVHTLTHILTRCGANMNEYLGLRELASTVASLACTAHSINLNCKYQMSGTGTDTHAHKREDIYLDMEQKRTSLLNMLG